MTKKKVMPKKMARERNMLDKIAGQIGHLAGEIVVGKNHLKEMAGHAIDSVKETMHSIATKNPTQKSAREDTALKPPAKRTKKSATKKIPPKKTSSVIKQQKSTKKNYAK
jgi:hypothetical protein